MRRIALLIIGSWGLLALLDGALAGLQGPIALSQAVAPAAAPGLPGPSPTPTPPPVPPLPLSPQVGGSVQNDLSPPLQFVTPVPPAPDPTVRVIPRLPLPKGVPSRSIDSLVDQPAADPSSQKRLQQTSMPSPIRSFDGINNIDNVLPPDPNGDVGPNHYVQWVNNSFAVWDKSGNLLYGPAAGNTLWSGFGGACQTQNDGDPIVLYDPLADRWLMSQFALPNYPNGPFYQCIAVSQTPDPTGAYYRYAFLVSETKMNDYSKFGVWPDGYYMSVNQFASGSATWAGAGAYVFDRARMLAGSPATFQYFDLFSVNANFGGMLPADLDGARPPPAGSPNYFAEMDDAGTIGPSDALRIWEFHVDWTNPSNSRFGLSGQPNAVLGTAAFDPNMCGYAVNCIPQPGTSRLVDALSNRLMYRLQYRNFGDRQSLVANHTVDVDGNNHAGIRWYELRDTGSGWSIFQQGTYAPDADHRWMGSIAMDSGGNMALGYSVSSSSVYPSIRYTGRLAGDPPGVMAQGEYTLMAGGGSQNSSESRWGDYSMMAVDPVDDCTFWYTQEYYQSTSNAGWRTRIGSFKFPSCVLSPSLTTSAMAGSRASASPGDVITYSLTLTSTAYLDASNARITDTLPVSVTYVPGSATGGATYLSASRSVAWAGAVSAGSPVSVSYSVVVTSPLDNGAVITNTATVNDGLNAPFDTAPVATTIVSSPNLATSAQTVSSAYVRPGGAITYSLVLTNTGNMNASSARVTDTLPVSVTYLEGIATGGATYIAANRTVVWSGAVVAGSPLSITYSATAGSPLDSGTLVTNTATVHDGVNAPFETAPVTTAIDASPPAGFLAINGGAEFTNAITATLAISGTDNTGSDPSMAISNDAAGWLDWQVLSANMSWALASGPDGPRTVYTRFRDPTGNISPAYSSTITLDTEPPTGGVSINAGAADTNSAQVALTLSAWDSAAGVSSMQLSNDGQTYDPWEGYAAAKSWGTSGGDGAKTVYARFRDSAGNISAPVSDTIFMNTAPPSSTVTALAQYVISSPFAVSWSGLGLGGGIASFDVQYRDGTAGQWADWLTSTVSTTAAFAGADGRTYYFRIRARDRAGNVELYPGGDGDTRTTVDLGAPRGSVSVNGGALDTTAVTVTLSVSATDSGSGVARVSFSNDGVSWGGWESHAVPGPWTLPPGDGEKTVWARFEDIAGNVSNPVSSTLRLDTSVSPAYGLSINDGALFSSQVTVTLVLPANPNTAQMMISNDGGFTGAEWEPFRAYRPWAVSSNGTYVDPRVVYVKYRGVSGSVSGVHQDSITLDLNPPTGSLAIEAAAPATGTVQALSGGVTLRLSAIDLESGIGSMMVSNSPAFTGATWEGFQSTKPWTVGSGGRVYAVFRDRAGNASPVYAAGPSGERESLPPVATGTVHPRTGGAIVSDQSRSSIAFPPGAFAATAEITLVPAVETAMAADVGGLRSLGKFMTITARAGKTEITSVGRPYTITVGYVPSDLAWISEATLGIYWWDGSSWRKEPTSRVDRAAGTVSATFTHLSSFAVLGESSVRRTYLPVVARNGRGW